MRDDVPRRRWAWRQAALLVGALLALAALMLAWQQQAANRDELKIPLAALRSQAAELALLLAQSGDPLPPCFVRAQATQLARAVGQSRDELHKLRPQPALEPMQERAEPLARRLEAAVQQLQAARSPPGAEGAAAARSLRDALKALEQSLERPVEKL
jgi:hypothetical protein